MNREIKFRVWDTENQEFFYPDELRIQYNQIGWTSDHYLDIDSYGIKPEEYVLQQFTGLFDKNGKEIYEGDILNWESNSMSHRLGECKRTRVVSVKWHEKSASFIAEANKHNLLQIPIYWKMDANDFNGKPFIKEVIGNVFENKELLA